ncbi:hypothetical protein EJB05_49279 [Eragrostis curvula]|uniref:Uncharacterized protein n=1 Tax=Eragrostis curvula TaxID=38414 RepID=A0A5J9T4D8_9POAL|nr:hypothetical protein EJB05_49279 [Eragrostis curvula]
MKKDRHNASYCETLAIFCEFSRLPVYRPTAPRRLVCTLENTHPVYRPTAPRRLVCTLENTSAVGSYKRSTPMSRRKIAILPSSSNNKGFTHPIPHVIVLHILAIVRTPVISIHRTWPWDSSPLLCLKIKRGDKMRFYNVMTLRDILLKFSFILIRQEVVDRSAYNNTAVHVNG